jgi:hypothetical protein
LGSNCIEHLFTLILIFLKFSLPWPIHYFHNFVATKQKNYQSYHLTSLGLHHYVSSCVN